MAEESGTTEVFQKACRHVGFLNAFAHNAFVERFFQDRLSSEFTPEDFALVLTNSHLEDDLVDFFKDDGSSPGAQRHWLFSSAMKNYRDRVRGQLRLDFVHSRMLGRHLKLKPLHCLVAIRPRQI